LWGAIARSPMATGMSSTLLDNLFNMVGGPVNEAMGNNVMPQARSRFQREQGGWGMLGPTAGIVAGTLPSAAIRAADGDIEQAFDRIGRLIPIWNTIGIQTGVRAYKAATGD